ncbi:MAG: peptidoglycan editing factor PgeF [Anaerolineae bacterium]
MRTIHFGGREVFSGDGLRYEFAGSLPVYRFEQLNGDTSFVHAVFTRAGGVSRPPYASLNLGHTVGDDPLSVQINHERVYQALGVARSRVVTCHLTHSADVLTVRAADGGQVVGQGDAMITADVGVYLAMRFADCVPILLHDPVRRAVGLAHAGWRGTVKNVAGAVVRTMVDRLGCSADHLVAVIGPAIGPCCYQVGPDVIQAVERVLPPQPASDNSPPLFSRCHEGHAYFNLWEANRRQLEAAGAGTVVVAGLCTACRPDRFFSHRGEGGKTGRFGVVIGYGE